MIARSFAVAFLVTTAVCAALFWWAVRNGAEVAWWPFVGVWAAIVAVVLLIAWRLDKRGGA